MALQETVVPISFNQGLDTKTDSKQETRGKLVALQNGVFTTGNEIRKRNGHTAFTQNIQGGGTISSGSAVSSFQDELVCLDGNNLYSYSDSLNSWINRGALPLVTLAVQSIIRTSTKQTVQDVAYHAGSGLYCYVWYDSVNSGEIHYSILDAGTGTTIVNNQVVASGFTQAKVLTLGSNFIIIYSKSGSGNFYYKAISTSTPQTLGSQVTIATDGTSCNFDAEVIGGTLYIAYDGGTSIKMYSLSSSLVLSSQYVNTTGGAASGANCVSVVGDGSNNVWVGFSKTNTYLFVVNSSLTSVLATTEIEAQTSKNLTMLVSGTTATLYYEGAATDWRFIRKNTCTLSGTVGTASDFIRSVGLASKAFTIGSNSYVLANYPGSSTGTDSAFQTLQPTYFLLNQNAQVVAKVASKTAGELPSVHASILPEVVISSNSALLSYLIQDDVSAENGSMFTNSGVNAATLNFATTGISTAVQGNNLLIASARPSSYDGATVCEAGFNLYPDNGTITPTYTDNNGGLGIQSSASYKYQYCALYSWRDNQGQVHRSAPSIPVTLNMGANRYLKQTGASFTNGSTSATVADSSQMQVGMRININGTNGGWEIFAINSATSITVGSPLNRQYTGPTVTNATIYVTDVPSITFYSGTPSQQSYQITGMNSVSGLFIGQEIIDDTATPYFPTGTTITAIDTVNNAITVSNLPLISGFAGGASLSFYTIDTYSTSVSVPTIRLTDKKNVVIELYRTEANGTIFYLASSLTSPTYNDPTVDSVTFTDTIGDAALIGNQQLYTTGGELEDYAPPALTGLVSYKSRTIGIPTESTLSFLYTKQIVPGSPPEWNDLDFIENVDSKIGSIGTVYPMDDKLIIFGPTKKFVMVGDGPAPAGNNNDFSEPIPIAGTSGCTNPNSVVETPGGLMYQSGSNGIWLLDRSLEERYIGAEVEAYNAYTVTAAFAIPNTTQVRFTLSNGTVLVYDYYYEQWSTFTNINAVSACLYQNKFTYITSSGQVLQETPGTFTDNGAFIQLSLTTSWLLLPPQFLATGGLGTFRRVRRFLLLGDYKSAHTLQIQVAYDFDSTVIQTTNIPVTSNPGVYNFRVHLAQQKCEAIQLTISDTQTSPFGEGMALSAMSFEAAYKMGLKKMPASASYG